MSAAEAPNKAGRESESSDTETSEPIKPVVASTTTATPAAAAQATKEAPAAAPSKQANKEPAKLQLPSKNEAPRNKLSQKMKAQRTKQVQLEPPADAEEYAEDHEVEEESEEPSEALIMMTNTAKIVLKGLLKVSTILLSVIVSSLRMVLGLLPLTLHMAVFLGLLYVLAEYVVNPLPGYVDFVGRLRYVVRCLAWTLLPAVTGYIVSRWKRTDIQRRFADETFRLVAMLGLNSAVFATYAKAECMHYVWLLHVLIASYSCCYWLSLSYGGAFARKSFSQPPVAALFLFMTWNFWTILTQDLGYGEQPPQLDNFLKPQGQDTGELQYWQYTTMCEMVERVFCTVDENPRVFYQ